MQTVELYHIFGNALEYFITSAPRDYVYLGNTYTATTLERNSQNYQAELTVAKMQINLAYSSTYSVLFNSANSFKKIQIILTKLIINDNSSITSFILFSGWIYNITVSDGILQITAQSLLSELNKILPKMNFQTMCNNTLFDANCGLSSTMYAIQENTCAIGNNGLLISGTDTHFTGYFTQGKIYSLSTKEYRIILWHSYADGVAQYTINVPFSDNGTSFTVYPGCNKTPDLTNDGTPETNNIGCINCCGQAFDLHLITRGFNNISHFLGFPYIPAGGNSNIAKGIQG